jgi:RecB family endonuclease NucS
MEINVSLQFMKHEVVSLKNHPSFSESWLQDIIANDPSVLGLGDLDMIERERVLEHAGRLDLLLNDGDGTRYEVELMLGPTDPSHIIRCIEYWDSERRRYPGYEHIAVLIAEDITTRFLNVMSLMAGNIPLIAIQLSALKVENYLVLNFIKVLNQTALRRDDVVESGGQEVNLAYWEDRASTMSLAIMDECFDVLREVHPTLKPKYNKFYVGVSENGQANNFVTLKPKKKFLRIEAKTSNQDDWKDRLDENGFVVLASGQGKWLNFTTAETLNSHRDLLKELFTACRNEQIQ